MIDKKCTVASAILQFVIIGLMIALAGLLINNMSYSLDPVIVACSLGVVPVVHGILIAYLFIGAVCYLVEAIITLWWASKTNEKYYMRRFQIIGVCFMYIGLAVICAVLMAIVRQGVEFYIIASTLVLSIVCIVLMIVDYVKQVKIFKKNYE